VVTLESEAVRGVLYEVVGATGEVRPGTSSGGDRNVSVPTQLLHDGAPRDIPFGGECDAVAFVLDQDTEPLKCGGTGGDEISLGEFTSIVPPVVVAHSQVDLAVPLYGRLVEQRRYPIAVGKDGGEES
jgi:hypothetical protein